MVSSTELRDRQAGEAGVQPCDGKDAVEDIDVNRVHDKSLEEINQSKRGPQIPVHQCSKLSSEFRSIN